MREKDLRLAISWLEFNEGNDAGYHACQRVAHELKMQIKRAHLKTFLREAKNDGLEGDALKEAEEKFDREWKF